MRLDGLQVASLVVLVIFNFLGVTRVALGWRKVVIPKPAVDRGPNLFDRQLLSRVDRPGVIPLLTKAAAQQKTQSRDVPVTMNATPAANFELIHAKLFLGGAETLLDRPSSESDLQQPSERYAVATDDLIGKKVLPFAGQDIATNKERVLPGRQLGLLALAPKGGVFDFPDLGAAVGILDSPTLPFLIPKDGRIPREVIDATAWIGFANAGLAASTPLLSQRTGDPDDLGLSHPTVKTGRNFAYVRLFQLLHRIEKAGVAAVQFVEGPGLHADAVAQGATDQVDGDFRFGLELNVVGDVAFLSTHRIAGPVLRKIKATVQQALKARSGVTDVNTDDTVFNLATVAVVLPCDPDGVTAAFVRSRFVDQADRLWVSVIASDDLLAAVAKFFFIPLDRLQKSL